MQDKHLEDTVLQIILRQFNASTRLVETFFISVPGKVSKINPKFSLSLPLIQHANIDGGNY